MSTNYLDEVVSQKIYTPNVVIKIGSTNYFAIREPDSGLSIPVNYRNSVASLLLNPTQIDIQKVTTTISSFSFKIVDTNGFVTALILGDGANLVGAEVRIYLGRSGVSMAFADYFELPLTYVSKLDRSDGSYTFASAEQTQRMNKPIYAFSSALAVDILAATTIWTMRDDISTFPTAGFLKCEDEFVSYTGVDLPNNRFTGIIRGELGSTPVDHEAQNDCVLVETVTDNPLNIILKILISGGGGGTYDVLQDGLGIDQSLIDIAAIEALRDELFLTDEYTLSIYSVDSALRYLEDELLMPNNLRLTASRLSKITLAILDKAIFVEEDDVIDADSITKFPKWAIDGVKVSNQIEVQWGFNEGTGKYEQKSVYSDAASIAIYAASTPLKFAFRGIKAALGGQLLVDDFGTRLLARLAYPTPTIQVNTQIDKSLQTIGDKAYLVSDKIPAADGTLNFASNLEIISRSINQTTGDVAFTLVFTSFTNFRSGFIAPSDLIIAKTSQSIVEVASGRGAQYQVGWYMRLWDEVNQVYRPDAVNKITDIDGDELTFETAWATTITLPANFRLRFADYDDATTSEKRYCFISDNGADFGDAKPTYKVTY